MANNIKISSNRIGLKSIGNCSEILELSLQDDKIVLDKIRIAADYLLKKAIEFNKNAEKKSKEEQKIENNVASVTTSLKTTDDTQEHTVSSGTSSNRRSMDSTSQDNPLNYTIRHILPPISVVKSYENLDDPAEDEIDPYDELNKQWKCSLQ